MSNANPFIQNLISEADDRFSQDSINMCMTEWIEKNTTIKGKPFELSDGYDFQKAIIDDMHDNMVVIKPSQVGLALALETPVITPTGWSTMGRLQVGDIVYDEQGQPTTVQYVSPIYTDHKCYELTFDDGEKIVADENHRWYVECDKAFHEHDGLYNKSGRLPKGSEYKREGLVSTSTLAKGYRKGNRNLFAIPNTQALVGEDKDISVDPYYLGYWLGDGSSASTYLTSSEEDAPEVIRILEDRGLVCKTYISSERAIGIKVELPEEARYKSMQFALSELNVRKHKHIPEKYLRGSIQTRTEVLQGMMDSDGSITKRGRCSFYNTNPSLIQNFVELANSLGFKTRTRWRKASGGVLKSGQTINSQKDIAEVSFVAYSDNPVFKLNRKADRLPKQEDCRVSEVKRRRIVDVTAILPTPVRCISVDSPNHLFLAGKGMIPTHNTEAQIRKALAFLIRNQGTSLIFTLPTEDMYKRISKGRIKPIVDKDRVFNSNYDKENKAVRSVDMMQFGQSFLYLTPAIESAATSINADVVMNDEVDLSDQKMVTLFNSRLQGSKIAISQRFSTPTFPQFGVDLDYQASDQHEYLCRCKHCGVWNNPEFNRKFIHIPGLPDDITELHKITIDMQDMIDLDNSYVMCEKCKKPLDLDDSSQREWVPKFPGRSSRGYKVTPFVTGRLNPKYIVTALWRYQKTEFLRGFFNTVLGLPYSDGSIQIPREMILACMTDDKYDVVVENHEDVWVGIDMGQTCHIVLGKGPNVNNLHIFKMLSVHVDDVVQTVKDICEEYSVRGGAVDRHPYEPTSREIFEASGNRILPVEYRGMKEVNLVFDEYEEVKYAQVNRTSFLDNFAMLIRKAKIKISGYGMNKETYIEHLRDMVRDETPDKPAEWKKLTQNDHFFHASAFMAIGPKIAEMIGLQSNSDTRTMTSITTAVVSTGATNLVGVSNKRVDSHLGIG